MKFWGKVFLIFIISIPILFTVIYLEAVYKKPYVIISEDDNLRKDFAWETYTDKLQQGKSEIIKNAQSPYFEYRYTLKEGYKYKFALISITEKDFKNVDLSGYNQINMDVKASHGKGILFYVYSHFPQYAQLNLNHQSRPHQYILHADTSFKRLSLSMDDLYTPDWWYLEANETKASLEKPVFDQVMAISFGNCVHMKSGITDQVTIKNLSFSVNLFQYFLKIVPYILTYYLLLIAGYFFYQRKRRKLVLKENDVITVSDDKGQLQLLLDTIGLNYFQSDYTIENASEQTNLSEETITKILKRKSGLTFKQLINNIRINEASRLLTETDLPVNEVAAKVGFNTTEHFNRVFKTQTGLTPLEARKGGLAANNANKV